MISEEIKAKQEAYAARPFAVRWEDSHVALTQRFHTFDEAFQYAQDMWTLIQRNVKLRAYRCSSNLYRSNIQTPEGKIALRYYFLSEDVSSY